MNYTFEPKAKYHPDEEYKAIIQKSIGEEILKWDEVYPKDWGLNYDYYRHYSKYGTGWNKASNLFHLEFKTHAWLRFQVLENLYIGNAMCYGEYININKTFNAGDIVTINMAKVVEFGKRGQVSSNSANITAYYLLPFVWHNFIKEESDKYIKEYYKNETQYNYLRDHYYKSKVKEIDNNRRYFRNGYDKFVEDDTLSSLLNLDMEVENMMMAYERGLFGLTDQLYYISEYNLPYWMRCEYKIPYKTSLDRSEVW